MNIHQKSADLFQDRNGSRAGIDAAAVASVNGEFTGDQQAAVLVRGKASLLQKIDGPLIQIHEQCGDTGFLLAVTYLILVHSSAEDRADRTDDHRFTCTGLTGKGIEPFRKIDDRFLYDCQISDVELRQHPNSSKPTLTICSIKEQVFYFCFYHNTNKLKEQVFY